MTRDRIGLFMLALGVILGCLSLAGTDRRTAELAPCACPVCSGASP